MIKNAVTSDGDIVEAAWSFGITFATGTIGFGIGSAFKGITGSTFVIGHVVTDLNIGIATNVFTDVAKTTCSSMSTPEALTRTSRYNEPSPMGLRQRRMLE